MTAIVDFLLAYLLTNITEFFPLALLSKEKTTKVISVLGIINTSTLPLVWLFLPLFPHYLSGLVFIESLVVVAETVLLKLLLKQETRKAFVIALAMNLLSTIVGLVVF